MINMMRIMAVLLVIAAIATLSAAVVLGRRPDPARLELLAAPSITAKFEKPRELVSAAQSSPLIVQSQLFKNLIDPPPPPPPPPPVVRVERTTEINPQPPTPTPPPPPARFDVLAISYNPEDSGKSFALVKQGNDTKWLTVGDKISHATVASILEGKITTNDGREYVPAKPRHANLLAPESALPPSYGIEVKAPTSPAGGTRGEVDSVVPVPAPAPEPAAVAEPVAVGAAEPVAGSVDARESIEWLRQIITDPESMGLSPDEAAQLGDIGRMLGELEQEASIPIEAVEHDPGDVVHEPPVPYEPNEIE